MTTSPAQAQSVFSLLKHFLALSRTPHGVLDMAAPALAALLGYGSIPPPGTVILGLITAFAGYTAVYALNDLVDFRVDKKRVEEGLLPAGQGDLDSIFVRHPLAQGLLSFPQALFWALGWSALAVAGAYLLNPFCLVFFLAGCLLETAYCLMWQSSSFKIVISGAVKTLGGLAAVYAVDPDPSLTFVALLFLWLFFWEVGGQNLPNDWADIEEDLHLRAATIPARCGPGPAKIIIFSSLILTLILNLLLLFHSRMDGGLFLPAASFGAGIYLLLLPALPLLKTGGGREAQLLFNRSSYYPLTLLALAAICLML